MQNFDHAPKKILVTGGSGTGKTTLAKNLMFDEKARLKFVYDHDGQFSLRYGIEAISSAAELDEKVAKGGWVVYDPSLDFDGRELPGGQIADLELGLEVFCDYVLAQSRQLKGRKLLYIDEVDILTTNTKYPRSLVAVMQTGRRYEIDCVLIAGQPNNLHNRVRTQLTEVYTFFHNDEAALKFLTENCIPEETIRGLGEHGHYYRHLRTGDTSTSIKPTKQHALQPDTGKAPG